VVPLVKKLLTMSDGKPLEVFEYKVVLIGPCGVGKTSIIKRAHEDRFSSRSESTITGGFVIHRVATSRGPAHLHIWDTAGQERYKSLVPMYSRNAAIIAVVFDITSQRSFEDAKEWCETYRSPARDDSQLCFLIANKSDLDRQTNLCEVRAYAQEANAHFFVTSAKSGEGIGNLFDTMGDKLIMRSESRVTRNMVTAMSKLRQKEQEKQPCC
jgi:Ras-related protein Rab-5C